ncbi:MAG: hypothetical protein ACREQD_09495, partial [Candidatus Binataceae bacterium]
MWRRRRIICATSVTDGVAHGICNECSDQWFRHIDVEFDRREFLLGVGRLERPSGHVGLAKSDGGE